MILIGPVQTTSLLVVLIFHKSLYKFEVRLPFSRQRDSLEINPVLHRSSRARLTVERESRSSVEIVRIPGQHLPSLSA